jgi:hypothetical protein
LNGGIWSNDDDNRALIRWLLGVAEKGIMDMPFFPDITVLRAIVHAIENRQIVIPEEHKEAVAKAILQIKLDFEGQL